MIPVCVLTATLGGAGYVPKASGTLGTFIGLLICLFLPTSTVLYLVLTVAVIAVSIPVSFRAEQFFGRDDDRRIIIDELAGFMVAVAFIPKTFLLYGCAFVLFRFFDITKIVFIDRTQKLPVGIGVVADDVLAGLYANFILQLCLVFLK
ncbi:MAG: phosphatidylglycerophosphatase A [Elusimicrobia bacterium]|nr:phosphatidylglycerophosphatase A [Elusimicrobiota bacterium]MBD3412572.1 phosphatidylglycerophosphatase A [Elusimicrobiota bacterium]